jgi:hypothetical protein
MENEFYILPNDRTILCVKAASFPDGIMDAFKELNRHIQENDTRIPYGISKPEKNGTIVYRSGVEEAFPGEAAEAGCESLVLKKGKYVYRTISEWQTKIEMIGNVFNELLRDPRLDPASPCIEIYQSRTELICMVRIIE